METETTSFCIVKDTLYTLSYKKLDKLFLEWYNRVKKAINLLFFVWKRVAPLLRPSATTDTYGL
jgi:hypothetical protein